jgi:LPXTG-site transpeptidase (sortase) family protein
VTTFFAVFPLSVGKADTSTASAQANPTASTTKSLTPKLVFIPKLSVGTVVESVGMTEDGAMDTPDDWQSIAWYQPGFAPGEKGHTALAAHRDWQGQAGPFFDLQKLQPGDGIFVAGDGRLQIYAVTESTMYDRSDDTKGEVFGTSSKPELSLITCEGQFLNNQDTYKNRRVIQAELINSLP